MKAETRETILTHLERMRSDLELMENLIMFPPALLNPRYVGEAKAVPIIQAFKEDCDAIEDAIERDSQSL